MKAAFVAGAAMLLGMLVPTAAVADGTAGAHGHHAAHSSRANRLDGP